jgi:hypothetical protein
VPLLVGQSRAAPVAAAAGALEVTADTLEIAAAELEEMLDELGTKTAVGVQAHWYPVLEMMVVTVTVDGVTGLTAAELVTTGAELATGEELATAEEIATAEELFTTPARINLPPMMLLLMFAPVTALFR